jgi:hypothetical protein
MGSVTADRRGVASAALGTMRTFGMMSGEAISAAPCKNAVVKTN